MSEKKRRFQKEHSKRSFKPAVLVVALFVITISSAFLVVRKNSMKTDGETQQQITIDLNEGADVAELNSTETVSIPVADVNDGIAHYFDYDLSNGTKVKYFLVKSSDGIIRAAFDACDVCYGAKKGYTQKGDLMVCNNCGRQFPTARINVEEGGCNPAPLVRNVVGNQLELKVSDIAAGSRYF